MRSLFVVGLPRSLSDLVYQVSRTALGLQEPIWTTDGEILNVDRMAHYRGERSDEGAKFTTMETDPELFHKLTHFLTQVTVAEGFAYKDVVHPFVVAAWPELDRYRVLRIKRKLADVAYSMLSKEWYYPQSAAIFTEKEVDIKPSYVERLIGRFRPQGSVLLEEAANVATRSALVIKGLVLADLMLSKLPAEVVEYDQLIESELPLERALTKLYPEADLPEISYIDERFCRRRRETLKRRKSSRYREIEEMISQTVESFATNIQEDVLRVSTRG